MQNLYNDLAKLLEGDESFFVEGKVLKNKVTESALKLDVALIKLLLGSEPIKAYFFVAVEGVLVFDQDKFVKFVNNKEFLPDSFTSFKNNIGLAINGDYLKEREEVVLAWPYKDCVLEGGQDKEESKRKEVFYNEILAPDEIDRLFEPKVLTNIKRFDENGEQEVGQISDKDNLIVKGNNLLALHSLKKRYRGKVKMIYIDPPYNTGNDSFNYNDTFSHSTWLTFMKNRLEVAKEFLRNDGQIFVSINHIELGYILTLMDEVFGRENKQSVITLRAGTTASYRSINDCPVNVAEYVIAYRRSKEYVANPVYIEAGYSEDYSHFISNKKSNPSSWSLVRLDEIIYKKEKCKDWKEFKNKFGATWKKTRLRLKEDFAMTNADSVVSLNTLQKPSEDIQRMIDKSKKIRDRVFVIERDNNNPIYCLNGRTLAFFSTKLRLVDGEKMPSEILTNLWTDVSFLGLGNEGGVDLPNGKKPEVLVQRMLEVATKEGDLILDYHLGSGTTSAVAHKMKRRYIGIEQLDYEENGSVNRLKNVIKGESGGISSAVGWTGGGSFVYFELKQWNQNYIDDIKKVKSGKEALLVYKKMQSEAFFRYAIDLSKFEERSFSDLSVDEQKNVLLACLDKNHLYVNYSEIKDSTYKVSVGEQKQNQEFYGG